MNDLDKRSPRTRWVLWAVATVALAATVVTCKSVTDNLLMPRQPATEAANCVSDCAKAANDAIRVESDLHVANVQACNDDAQCLANEEARHEAAVAAIQARRKQCQDNCHDQGAGNGGR
jgi:hypothetical protein